MTTLHLPDLTLRPITAADADDPRVIGWHTDPEGYQLMAEQPDSPDAARENVLTWADSWKRDGISYWVAERDGEPVGLGGVRRLEHDGRAYLNLYYRLAPAVRGAGLATRIASAATVLAAEKYHDLPVVARISPRNEPSLKTAQRAGMMPVGTFRSPHDPTDEPDSELWQSPVVALGVGGSYDDLLDLWCRVNASGGAVGWQGAAPREEVAAVLDGHLAADACTLVRMHAPTARTWDDPTDLGRLLGFGFVQRGTWFSKTHRATLLRVMTDPDLRRRNLGHVLMGALHGVAREQGIEICEVHYRGGTGLEGFYASLGYVETGRVAGGLRFVDGDVDDVSMARRL